MSQETEQNGWTNADLFRRDGHLTDLTLERFDAEPMPEDQTQLVQEHLSACARCTELLAEVRAQDPLPSLTVAAPEVSVPRTAATATPESAPASNVIAFPIRPRHLGMAATLLAAAAALFVVLRPGPELVVASPGGDGIRLRGSAVTMEVILDDQSHGRILEQNDVVHPGDRIGFRVRARRAGHLLVLGVDDRDTAYPCYPQRPSASAVAFEATDGFVRLEEAIRFDAIPGREKLAAILCDQPFDIQRAARAVLSGLEEAGLDGCAIDRLVLIKKADGGTSL